MLRREGTPALPVRFELGGEPDKPTWVSIESNLTQERYAYAGEMDSPEGAVYVAISEIAVDPDGTTALEQAFRKRLGAVDAWPGFLGLEVLRHRRRPGCYLMISRWNSKEQFQDYMRSQVHRASHDRIPGGRHAPRPAGFDDYEVVAT